MKKKCLSLIASVIVIFGSMAYAQTGILNVEISGVNDIKGLMSIGVYSDEKGFPDKGKEFIGIDVEINSQMIVYTFKYIPFGTYAIAVFHDVNSNTKLDTNFLGIPREGYAFSNNLFGAFGSPPGFNDASFQLTGDKTIKIKMEY